ncbi:hypothetical protein BH11ACT7_BH11ACT7_42540 [soil metagenome]
MTELSGAAADSSKDSPPSHGAVRRDDDLADAADGLGLFTTFQQIVSLPDQGIIGYEALARWPHSHASPEAVFEYAARYGNLELLDSTCIQAATVSAMGAEMAAGTTLFVNTEPSTLTPDALDFTASHRNSLRVVFELTERDLLDHPRALMAKIASLRARGFGIALDDVGTDDRCLAALDLLAPDVIKLRLQQLHSAPTSRHAQIMSAVLAHRDRSGAHILVEGIESPADLDFANAIGAELGQGFLFGYPGPVTRTAGEAHWAPPPFRPQPLAPVGQTPFSVVAAASVPRRLTKPAALQLSRIIEEQALLCADAPMILTAIQRVEHFSAATRQLYTRLADTAPWVVIFGDRVPSAPAPGVRGVHLHPDDAMNREWIVLSLGTYSACALACREVTEGTGPARMFDTALTYDRATVVNAAAAMLHRML